jgi:putative ABC transport system permease protein
LIRDRYVGAVQARNRHFVRALFTFDEWTDFALLQERLVAGLSTAGAFLAVVLACVGVYSLLAYSVALRTREVGLRMAIGATREQIIRMVLREGAGIVAVGVLIGAPAAVAVATLVRARLYGVAPSEPWPIVAAAIAFITSGMAASLIPAIRASRVEPSVALRCD